MIWSAGTGPHSRLSALRSRLGSGQSLVVFEQEGPGLLDRLSLRLVWPEGISVLGRCTTGCMHPAASNPSARQTRRIQAVGIGELNRLWLTAGMDCILDSTEMGPSPNGIFGVNQKVASKGRKVRGVRCPGHLSPFLW